MEVCREDRTRCVAGVMCRYLQITEQTDNVALQSIYCIYGEVFHSTGQMERNYINFQDTSDSVLLTTTISTACLTFRTCVLTHCHPKNPNNFAQHQIILFSKMYHTSLTVHRSPHTLITEGLTLVFLLSNICSCSTTPLKAPCFTLVIENI